MAELFLMHVGSDVIARLHRRAVTDWSALQRLLALLACTGLAITDPVLSLLGDTPVLFIFNGLEGWALVWTALVVALVPPLTLWGLGALAFAVSRSAGVVVHLFSLWGLLYLAGVQALKYPLDLETPVLIVAGALLAATVAIGCYVVFRAAELMARLMAIVPVIAVLTFLVTSPSSDLIGPGPSVVASANDNDLPPVVVLVLDELPTRSIVDSEGAIDSARFPNLAALAADGTWHRDFTSNAAVTRLAVPMILTGRVAENASATMEAHPDNLFSAFAPTHDLVAFETLTDLCGFESCVSEGRGAASDPGGFINQVGRLYRQRISPGEDVIRLDDFQEKVAGPSSEPAAGLSEMVDAIAALGGGVPERFGDFIGLMEPSDRPSLYVMHLVLPHSPWTYFEDGQLYESLLFKDEAFPFSAENDQGGWTAALTEYRHLQQAMYADRLVGRMIEQLKDAGLYDEAVIVVVSDHGISFETGVPGRSVESAAGREAVAYAPLIVKAPGQTDGVVDDSNVMAIDLVPTIADLAGIDLGYQVDGVVHGSAEQRERGEQKFVLSVDDVFGEGSVKGREEFRSGYLPTSSARWIQDWDAADDGMGDLHRLAGVDGLIGSELDDLAGFEAGSATVSDLERHEEPEEAPLALLYGRVDPELRGSVLVAVDDVVVAGSPIYEFRGDAGSFAVMLPSDLVASEKTIRLAVLDGESIRELSVSG